VLVFAFLKLRPDPNEAAAMRIEEVQINAGSVKLLGVATRGAGQASEPPAQRSGASAACLEWGPISAEDVPAADDALEKLALAPPPIRRPVADAADAERFSYFVREPDDDKVARIAELQTAFAGSEIKAGTCPQDLAGSSGSAEPPR
jgi:hypothetical protein